MARRSSILVACFRDDHGRVRRRDQPCCLLAGIPLTAGFLSKSYIVASGAFVGARTLMLILVVTSAIGLFYT